MSAPPSPQIADTVPAALMSLPETMPGNEAFAWPTPPFAAYPAPQRMSGPAACEIEGLDGKVAPASLWWFSPQSGIARVKVPPARATMPLRFAKFRRLTLIEPLIAEPTIAVDPHAELLEHRPSVPYRLQREDGETMEGKTVGHVETDYGLFLFTPLDDSGAVQRVFVPKQAYRAIEFGPRIGDVLVEQKAATEQQIEDALQEQQRIRSQRLGDILVTRLIVTPEQLIEAIEQQARMPMVRIGEALVGMGLISASQLTAALEQQKSDRSVPLGQMLVQSGLVTPSDLQAALARKMGYPVVDLASFPIDVAALRKVPYPVAQRLNCMPLLLRDSRLIVAVEDPSRHRDIEELEFVSQTKVVPTLAKEDQLPKLMTQAYERFGATLASQGIGTPVELAFEFDMDNANRLVESLELADATIGTSADDAPIEQSDNSLVRLINTMIIEAHGQHVSDIHIETHPGREKLQIRFRKDGLLRPYLELPHTYRAAMVARIKIMCDLDISERRKPQDGKINFAKFSPRHKVELRVATVPTANGLEDVVMRLLSSAKPLPLDKLGLSPRNDERLRQVMARPYGMVLCVGPTGSGKTTTLHAALGHINTPERKIWTAEDPIEITQKGLRQVQVNMKIDWTFAKALRAFLRADPDVIMVGEIRDNETAQMAVEASLTGHLVLSTLHTNNAAETVTRLLDMGMDPFNFGDSLLAVLAQRLVRRLCPLCKTTRDLTPVEIDEWLDDYLHIFPAGPLRPTQEAVLEDWRARFGDEGRLQHHHSPGCKHCDHTGMRGRVGIHEFLSVSRGLRHLIQTGARADELQALALAEGMRTLRQDGIEKVLQGLCSIEEVRATSNA